MKKTIIIFSIVIGVYVALSIIGKVTHTFMSFNINSPSNEPTITPGERFFASNLAAPKRMDLICFNATTKEFGTAVQIYRLCGLPGDIVEIRAGILYVNGENADKGLALAHDYFIAKKDYDSRKDSIGVSENDIIHSSPDTLEIAVSDKFISDAKIPATLSVFRKDSVDEDIKKVFNKDFNADNFGPVEVPANKYFVLGDNRRHAQDSRYLGFIDKKDYIATALWK